MRSNVWHSVVKQRLDANDLIRTVPHQSHGKYEDASAAVT